MAENINKRKLPKGVTKRKDGRYQMKYSYNGERFTIYDRDLKEVQKKYRTALYEAENGLFIKPEKITMDKWFEIWMHDYKLDNIKQETILAYQNQYRTHLRKSLGNKNLKNIRPDHLQKILNGMKQDGYSSSTINLVKVILSGLMKKAVVSGIIIRNPMEAVSMPKVESDYIRRVLTLDEQQLFLEYAQKTEDTALFLLLFSTGMRIGEALGLGWEHINYEDGMVQVRRTLDYRCANHCIVNSPKSKSSKRDVPLLNSVAKELRQLRTKQLKRKLLLAERWRPIEQLENLVFVNSFGKPLTRADVQRRIDKILRQINWDREEAGLIPIESFTPHAIRHTFATRAAEQDMKPKIVQEILGHSSIYMTMNIYTHVLPEVLKDEMCKVEMLFGNC